MQTLIKPEKVIYPELSYQITGLLFKVHNMVGMFGSEKQYGYVFERMLQEHGIAFEREVCLPATFIGENERRHKADFVIDDKVVVEMKARNAITNMDYSQTLRYLQAANMKLGILVNFHAKYIRPKRILNSVSS